MSAVTSDFTSLWAPTTRDQSPNGRERVKAPSRDEEFRSALDRYMADYQKRGIEKIPSRGFGAGCKMLFRHFWIGVPHGRRKLA